MEIKSNVDKFVADCGVIVGRFQVHRLHAGHHDMIMHALANHKRVIIFLGISKVICTKRNPLDYVTRELMIKSKYPDVVICPLPDTPSDDEWSRNLDNRILEIVGTHESVVLYGSRDSFIPYYHGKFATQELLSNVTVSGTILRESIKNTTLGSEDFRSGIIYGLNHNYDVSYQTVDVAITRGNEVLLGRKSGESGYRFIGGFVDVTDKSLEDAAKREVGEETSHIGIDEPRYVGSYRIDDWRYSSERSKIMTAFFVTEYTFGKPEPNDDIVELNWIPFQKIDSCIVPEHRILYNALVNYKLAKEK
jgi:bifunctional NMN adenylyltransferase/nudix hydrolase